MIEAIQKKLEGIYRLPILPQVRQYLLSPAQFQSIANAGFDQPQVLYLDEETDASVGIYLGKKIFKNITRNNHVFSLQDLCVVAEEVSHFVYLLWSKCNGKRINLLDLEIQAEVDKFLITEGMFPDKKSMIEIMFNQIRMRKNLTKDQADRYWFANRMGKKLAMDWEETKIPFEKKLKWLKFFYRQSPKRRISMIERGLF